MAVLDLIEGFSFAGLQLPYSRIRINGGLRDHIHEYPHVPGGAPEKLGRKLYEIHVSIILDSALRDEKWRDAWPGTYNTLLALFEDETTADLNIPGIGKIQAYCRDWPAEIEPRRNRSGLSSFELTFLEDQSSAFLILEAISVELGSLKDALDVWNEVQPEEDRPSIFDAITDAANSVFALVDQVELYGNLLEAKIRGLTSLIREADDRLNYLNDPANFEVLEALLELWQAANRLNEDLQQTGAKLVEYTVPIEMTIGDVAADLYGDAGRGGDIMSLNAITDPLAIPGGTVLRVYREAA